MDNGLQRAVLTLAVGNEIYVRMAANLARSFLWWHRDSDIQFFLATDSEEALPPDLAAIQIIHLNQGQYGNGFSPKLSLDLLAPAQRTLFVDADCLCAGSLEPIFARFAGRTVSAVGGKISEGDWFGDVRSICDRFCIESLPKFNGGIYYLEKGEASAGVYARARELLPDYDKMGLQRLRNRPNDELLMAIAMAVHSLDTLPDDGSILSSPFECPGPFTTDVMKGIVNMINPPVPDPRHRAWYPFTRVHPVVVHFLAEFNHSYQYRAEVVRLRFWTRGFLGQSVVRGWVLLAIIWRGVTVAWLKEHLRPLYHAIMNVRPVGRSERL